MKTDRTGLTCFAFFGFNRSRLVFSCLVVLVAATAEGQIFVSTGASSGLRMFAPNAVDWYLNPQNNQLQLLGGGSSFLAVLPNGNVGIGTTAPLQKLHLYSAGASDNEQIRLENGADNWMVGLAGTAGSRFNVADSNGLDNPFWIEVGPGTGGTNDSLVVKASGNVTMQHSLGVGMANTVVPSATLDVNGSARVRGASGLGLSPGLMVLVASGSFSNATTAAVALPSSYTSFLVVGQLQNTNASARTLLLSVGGDAGAHYNWSTLDQYVSGTELVGCSGGGYLAVTDSTSNTNRVAASAWTAVRMEVDVVNSSNLLIHGGTMVTVNDIGTSAWNSLQANYTGSTQGSLDFGMGTTSSCASGSVTSSSISGVLYVFALPL